MTFLQILMPQLPYNVSLRYTITDPQTYVNAANDQLTRSNCRRNDTDENIQATCNHLDQENGHQLQIQNLDPTHYVDVTNIMLASNLNLEQSRTIN
jgi:hypothetical protein